METIGGVGCKPQVTTHFAAWCRAACISRCAACMLRALACQGSFAALSGCCHLPHTLSDSIAGMLPLPNLNHTYQGRPPKETRSLGLAKRRED